MFFVVRVAFVAIYLVVVSMQQPLSPWDALNITVQGRLVRGIPFARPCFQLSNGTGGYFDPEACSTVTQTYLDNGTTLQWSFKFSD